MLWPWLAGHPGPFSLFLVLLLALLLDVAFGDPRRLYAYVPHPVVLIGRAVAYGERRLNLPEHGAARRRDGALLAVGVILGCAALGWGLTRLLTFPFGWLAEALLASTLLAYRGLYDGVRKVIVGLDHSLDAGRRAIGEIVGRDPDTLDEAGVARAAAESAAENFSDGVVVPIFWFALLGLPGLLAYKAVNTLDSMIGHRNARYADFGWAAARIDDAANWPGARLSALVIALAALLIGGANPLAALTTPWRDAGKHRSINAGWPEAALAGALGLALAGPRSYGSERIEDAWMGDGRADLTVQDLRRVLDLYVAMGAVAVLLVLAAAVLL